jgi:phage gp36-like protein
MASRMHAHALVDATPAPLPLRRELWSAVDRLVDQAASVDDLTAHGLHLLAARRCRELGRPVPVSLVAAERSAAALQLAAMVALERIRAAYDGPILILKGLELAARYPSATLRPVRDIDVLVEDPDRAQRALIDAGFEPVGHEDSYYASRHHLRPLLSPDLPALVEIHRRPEWVIWSTAPAAEDLLPAAVPSATGVDGILTPAPAHHALLVAAHSWTEVPLRRILDLVDVRLLHDEAEQEALADAAALWQLDGVLRTTIAAADALLLERPSLPWHVRLWTGDLRSVRERTVFMNHVRRLLSPFAALPVRRAWRYAALALVKEVTPSQGESWGAKGRRAGRAVVHAFRRVSAHDRAGQVGA